ncbi:hypothetical protein WDW37_07245 [Bdellovibrionota bacterium FG-1]
MAVLLHWFNASLSASDLSILGDAMLKHGVTRSRGSGFRVLSKRPKEINGTYFEKLEFNYVSVDPFGVKSTYPRTEYSNVNFSLTEDWPSIELRDCSRGSASFGRRLREYLGVQFNISRVEIEVLDWLDHIERAVEDFGVLSLDIDSVELSAHASGIVRITSDQDVRRELKSFVRDRQYRVVKALIRWNFNSGGVTSCELRRNGSVKFLEDSSERTVGVVREALKMSRKVIS